MEVLFILGPSVRSALVRVLNTASEFTLGPPTGGDAPATDRGETALHAVIACLSMPVHMTRDKVLLVTSDLPHETIVDRYGSPIGTASSCARTSKVKSSPRLHGSRRKRVKRKEGGRDGRRPDRNHPCTEVQGWYRYGERACRLHDKAERSF